MSKAKDEVITIRHPIYSSDKLLITLYTLDNKEMWLISMDELEEMMIEYKRRKQECEKPTS